MPNKTITLIIHSMSNKTNPSSWTLRIHDGLRLGDAVTCLFFSLVLEKINKDSERESANYRIHLPQICATTIKWPYQNLL